MHDFSFFLSQDFRKILPSFPFLSEETEGQLENDRASTHLS
jgi:hypothetical protein